MVVEVTKMADVRVPQLCEFFRQIDAKRVTSGTLQGFLDVPKTRSLTLEEYHEMVKRNRCYTTDCHGHIELESYDHEGGWLVDGFEKRQWLYTHCPVCGHDTSISKFGVPRFIVVELPKIRY